MLSDEEKVKKILVYVQDRGIQKDTISRYREFRNTEVKSNFEMI